MQGTGSVLGNERLDAGVGNFSRWRGLCFQSLIVAMTLCLKIGI